MTAFQSVIIGLFGKRQSELPADRPPVDQLSGPADTWDAIAHTTEGAWRIGYRADRQLRQIVTSRRQTA